MNCQEYRDMLAADAEALLDAPLAAQLHEHLDGCPECRAAADDVAKLMARLRGDAGITIGAVAVAQPAMDRILRTTTHQLRRKAMFTRMMRMAGGLLRR